MMSKVTLRSRCEDFFPEVADLQDFLGGLAKVFVICFDFFVRDFYKNSSMFIAENKRVNYLADMVFGDVTTRLRHALSYLRNRQGYPEYILVLRKMGDMWLNDRAECVNPFGTLSQARIPSPPG